MVFIEITVLYRSSALVRKNFMIDPYHTYPLLEYEKQITKIIQPHIQFDYGTMQYIEEDFRI